MRKTCRWLGCAALLCFTALELSGCSSKTLVSGFKLPGRKDRSAVARKDSKINAEESSDLLAQARAYEKEGDFPSAARTYREYLEGGGEPKSAESRTDSALAQTTKKSTAKKSTAKKSPEELDQTASLDQPRSKADARLTSKTSTRKTRKSDDTEADAASHAPAESGTAEDPWSNETAKPSAEESALAEATSEAQTATSDTALASGKDREHPKSVSPEDLENLLDMDAGKIDWGDEQTLPEANATAEVAQSAPAAMPPAMPEETSKMDLPLIDLNAKVDGQGMGTPVVSAAPSSDDWQSSSTNESPAAGEGVADLRQAKTAKPDELAPPIFEEEPAAKVAEAAFTEPQSKQSLAQMCRGCEPLVYAQVMKLESSDPEIRKEGLNRLADMGRKAHPAAMAVRTLLKDSDPLVKAHAAWACWEIENDPWESVGTLKPLLDNSNADVVELACYILGDIGAPAESTVEPLGLLRDHADGTTKIQAAEALIRIRGVDDKSLTALTTALKSKDGQVRWTAAVALGRCRGEQSSAVAVTALTAALKDIDPEVRSAAALSLGGLGKDAVKATPELQRIASSDTSQVREAALAALACLKL